MKFSWIGSRDVGIDLGTANVIVTVKGRGIVVNEPSVVAIDRRTEKVVAVGHEAKEMLGRTPEQIRALNPIVDGVIADFTATQIMVEYLLHKITFPSRVRTTLAFSTDGFISKLSSMTMRSGLSNSWR